jgi:hypothetical protein
VAGIAISVAGAYFIAHDIRYVLDADDPLVAVVRAAEVGGKFALGAAQVALFKKLLTGPGKAGTLSAAGAVMFFNALSDGGETKRREDEEEEKEKERWAEIRKEKKRMRDLALAQLLAETHPGSVEIRSGDDAHGQWIQVNDKKLWNEKVKLVDQIHALHVAEGDPELHRRARALGLQDGKIGEAFVSKNDIKGWPEVEGAESPGIRFMQLSEHYHEGFKEGNAKRAKVFERARKLGIKDAKTTGAMVHIGEIQGWPELAQLVMEGTPIFLHQLHEAYTEDFNMVMRARAKAD